MTESEVYSEIEYDHRRMFFPKYTRCEAIHGQYTSTFFSVQTRVKHPNMPVMRESHPFSHMSHY